jgi:hypothetical protein
LTFCGYGDVAIRIRRAFGSKLASKAGDSGYRTTSGHGARGARFRFGNSAGIAGAAADAAEVGEAAIVVEAGIEGSGGNDRSGSDGDVVHVFHDALEDGAEGAFAALTKPEGVGVVINGGTVG